MSRLESLVTTGVSLHDVCGALGRSAGSVRAKASELRLSFKQSRHLPQNVSDRFWNNVDRSSKDGCWPWLKWCDTTGYGRFSLRNKGHAAHRFAWELAYGPIPDGLWVLHKCDNPPCVNPAHLFLGTHRDNMDDATTKGRMRSGTEKLSFEDAVSISALYAGGGISQRMLAKRFGVSQGAISSVVRGKTWRSAGWLDCESGTVERVGRSWGADE